MNEFDEAFEFETIEQANEVLRGLVHEDLEFAAASLYPEASRSFARRWTHGLRAVGLHPAQIREFVTEHCSDRGAGEGCYDTVFEPLRREAAEAVQAGISEALDEPARKPLNELARRRSSLVTGTPIRLANGELWYFPELGLDRGAWTTPDGREVVGYNWRRAEWGPAAWKAMSDLVCEVTECASRGEKTPLSAMNRGIYRLGMILLRSQYRVTREECGWLIPLDGSNPACMTEIAIGLSEERPQSSDASRSIIVSGLVAEALSLKLELGRYLAPVVDDVIANLVRMNDDGKEGRGDWES